MNMFSKVPFLRNIALTAPYFHLGKVRSLRRVVGVMGSAQLGIQLTDSEAEKIVAFLHALPGDQPKVGYLVLPPITPSTH